MVPVNYGLIITLKGSLASNAADPFLMDHVYQHICVHGETNLKISGKKFGGMECYAYICRTLTNTKLIYYG